MTTATHPVTGQSAGVSMLGQPGTFGSGFPPPIGAEQYFGLVPQVPYPYAMPGVGSYLGSAYASTPWQSGITPSAFSSLQQVVTQIAPMVQQAILPHVIGAACQQVQNQLPQIVAQLVAHQGLQSQQQGTPVPGQGIFGQFGRPSYLPW
jgi:hypothetical protein